MKRKLVRTPNRTVKRIESKTVPVLENRTKYLGKTEETDVFAFENGSIIQYEDDSCVGFA